MAEDRVVLFHVQGDEFLNVQCRFKVVLLAGGGIRAGCRVGATDEIGEKAVEAVHPVNNEYQNCA